MYFLQQYKKAFLFQLASYQEAPEAGREVNNNPKPEDIDTPFDAEETLDKAQNIRGGIDKSIVQLPIPESLQEALDKKTAPEVSEYITPSPDEVAGITQSLRERGETELSPEVIKQETLKARLGSIESNEISQGNKVILEGEYIDSIAKEKGIKPELLKTLRAIDFNGIQGKEGEALLTELDAMADSISQINKSLQEKGIPIPESENERLALYDHLLQMEEIIPPLTEQELSNNNINTEVLPNGEVRIDPNTPGYTLMENGAVVGPPGSPSSFGGNVYSGGSNEISPDAGNISYDSLTEFTGGGELSESQKSQVENKENIALIQERFPEQWYNLAIEFCNKEQNIDPNKPIAIASCPDLIAIISYPGKPPKIEESPIAIGRNGYGPNVRADGEVKGQKGDGRTQTGRVQHFDRVRIAGVDKLAGGKTMTGAITESVEGRDKGGRWWHGGKDGRFPGHNTLGCVVAPDEFMIRLAEAVNRHGGGYGYQSEQKTSKKS